jgi:hypothetical protein
MVGVPGRIDGRYAAYGMRTTTPSRGAAAKTADSKPADKPSTDRTSETFDPAAPPGTYLNIKV